MTPEEIKNQKEVEFYAASVNAWFNTSLEHDKSLFTLSAGGIGLLLTLLTTVGLSSAESLVLYIGAILSFLSAIIAILLIFRCNRAHIEKIISGESEINDPILKRLDAIVLWSFGIGVLFTAVIGISAAINSYSTKEKNVTNETTKSKNSKPLNESFNGAKNLQPSIYLTNSFNGAANLQPKPATSTPTTGTGSPEKSQTISSQKQGEK